jgi:hypothetical protein
VSKLEQLSCGLQIERRQQVRAPAAGCPSGKTLLPLRFQLIRRAAVRGAQDGAPVGLLVQSGDEIPQDAWPMPVHEKGDHAVGVSNQNRGWHVGVGWAVQIRPGEEVATGASVLHQGRVPGQAGGDRLLEIGG